MKRKRGNAKTKTKLAPFFNVDEVIQSVVHANRHEWGLDDNYEVQHRVDIETAEKSSDRSNQRASGQNVKQFEKIVEDSTSLYAEPNVVASSNKPINSSRGISPLSGGADQVHNERSQRKDPTFPHQNLQFKDHELKAALAVIRKVMKMDAAAPFIFPVDPVALGIPDYLDVIETPMDFSTICNNLENGHTYRSSKDVFKDVQYIWNNCIKYNKKGHYILELLKRLKKKFMILWTEAGLFIDQQLEITGDSRVPATKPDMARGVYGHKGSLGATADCFKHSHQDEVDLSRHQPHQSSLRYAHSYQPQRRPYVSPSSSPEPLACRTVDNLESARGWYPCGHGSQVDATDISSTHTRFQLKQHQFSMGNCKSHQPHQTPCSCRLTRDQSQHSHQLAGTYTATAEHSHFPPLRESSSRQMEVSQPQCRLHRPAVNCSQQYQTQKRPCQDIPSSGRQLYSQSVAEFDITNTREEFQSPPLAESMIRYTKPGPTKYPPAHMADDRREQDQKAASPMRTHQLSLNCGQVRCGVDRSSSPVHATSDELHADVDMDSSESMISCAKLGSTIDPGDATPDIIRNHQREISLSQIQHQKDISEGPPSSSHPPHSHHQSPMDMFIAVPRELRKRSRGRGPTRCLDVWNSEDKMPVSTNEFGQPIGPEAPKFIFFLGTIARNGLTAPLNYTNWKAVPDENKERMWQLVVSRFSINPQSKDSILKSIGTKWKNWKALLKANHYTPHETDEERLADCNERVQPDQWRILVSFWNSSEAKERSNTNKANRSKYTSNHARGSKSFARVLEEQRIKRPEGKGPSQADLFIVTRTRKNGQPVNEASSAIISQLRDAAQKQGASQKDTIEDDVFVQVMGEETHGRVCTPGVGPTLSNLNTSKPLPVEAVRMVSEANAEFREMKEKMVAMEQTCAQMATQIATMMTMMQKKFSDKDPPNEDASKSSETPNEDASKSSETLEQSLSSSHGVQSLQRSTRSGKK